MKFWAAIGILVIAAVLGVIAYVVVDQYIYANGININLKLIAVAGTLAVIVSVVFLTLRRRRAP